MAEEKRKWWRSEPLDERGSKTMFMGLIIAFAMYGLSFVITAVYAEYSWAQPAAMVLILVSVTFLGIWFIAVRRGFRVGKGRSRAERRAEMHKREEKEKRMRLNR